MFQPPVSMSMLCMLSIPLPSTEDRQYSRGYSRGTSGASYVTGGGRSFDEGQSEFSETASSAQYYAQGQGTGGRSFMSSSSRGESFDEYR